MDSMLQIGVWYEKLAQKATIEIQSQGAQKSYRGQSSVAVCISRKLQSRMTFNFARMADGMFEHTAQT